MNKSSGKELTFYARNILHASGIILSQDPLQSSKYPFSMRFQILGSGRSLRARSIPTQPDGAAESPMMPI